MSARGTPAPKASAAIAWAPPTSVIASSPQAAPAASIIGCTPPSFAGGVTAVRSGTPAASAGSASMTRVENRGAVPPGM